MADGESADDAPEFAKGGLVLGPGDGSDSVPILINLHYERIFTAEQVRNFMAAKPGSDEPT